MKDLLVEFRRDLDILKELQITFEESLRRARVTKLPMIIDIAERNAKGNSKAIEKLTQFIEDEEKNL